MLHFGLIGVSLKHSFSEKYFKQKFESENILATYDSCELADLDSLSSLIDKKQLSGFNVTIPYKEKILPYLKLLHPSAKAVGAVNCVKISDGKLIGYNTDIIGFEKSFFNFITDVQNTKSLVFGTGGSSKAVQYCLSQNNMPFQLVSRIATENAISYDQIDEKIMKDYRAIINTTPVGMYPKINEVLPIPYHLIASQHFAYDLIYNPTKSSFLHNCQQKGASIKNGMEMLHIQAEESLHIFMG